VRLLLVDDDFISRKLMNVILSRYALCDIAVSGDEAVMAYKLSLKEGNPYGGVFLDILMPGSDGYSALERIRMIEQDRGIRPASRLKIVMCSSVDEPHMMMKAFKFQCDAYLMKPITEEKVQEAARQAGLAL